MPHINRIRVNNVKYNFGTQFYDDFMMRFSGKNAIYDLANGGGKSVLMLLLMQNLIPNCTLDEKQPLEKLFRSNEGSTTIHSMIEWILSDVHIHDEFKYMLTGFCARRAKDNGEEDKRDTARIEYFNYCIFYRKYNDNDIKNLPLSNGGERVTYTGLKNYLKELGKRDFNLEVHIFEKKGNYQRFISGYGLYESHWEIVRGINKTEGHVRTYFETNYRTTRKVVEELLIEEIIQKSFENRYQNSDEQDNMARTLLNIKDKLLELSKKKEDMHHYDCQMEALDSFSERVKGIRRLYIGMEDLELELAKAYNTLKRDEEEKKNGRAAEADKRLKLLNEKNDLNRRVDTAGVMKKSRELEGYKKELEEYRENLNRRRQELLRVRKELTLKECTNDYLDYIDARAEYNKIKEMLDCTTKDKDSLSRELSKLVAAWRTYYENAVEKMEDTVSSEREILTKEQETYDGYQDSLTGLSNRLAVSEFQLRDNKEEREKILALFTGARNKAGILIPEMADKKLKSIRLKQEENEKLKAELEEQSAVLVKNRQQYTYEKQQLVQNMEQTESRMEWYKSEIEGFEGMKERFTSICGVYGENDLLKLQEKIRLSIHEKTAAINDLKRRLSVLEKRFHARKEGKLFEEPEDIRGIMDYIERYHGDKAVSGLEYLKSMDKKEQDRLLSSIPILPYSVVIQKGFDELISDDRIPELMSTPYPAAFINEDVLKKDGVLWDTDNIYFISSGERITGISENEIENLKNKIERQWEIRVVMEEDYHFVLRYALEYDRWETANHNMEELKLELKKTKAGLTKLEEDASHQAASIQNISQSLENIKKELDNGIQQQELLKEVWSYHLELTKLDGEISKAAETYDSLKHESDTLSLRMESLKRQMEARKLRIASLEGEVHTLKQEWQEKYMPYYDEGVNPAIFAGEAKLKARLDGVLEAVVKENAGLEDRRRLMQNYKKSMDKALERIEYQGYAPTEFEKLYEENALLVTPAGVLSDMKADMKEMDKGISEMVLKEKELLSKCDRQEGNISNSIQVISDKYGYYEEEEISSEDIDVFLTENSGLLKQYELGLKESSEKIDAFDREINSCLMIRHDIENRMELEGIRAKDTGECFDRGVDIEKKCSEILKKYERFRNDMISRREDFIREKQMLMDTLKSAGGDALSEEIHVNVNMPPDYAETDRLIQMFHDTVECLQLEKDMVGRGIENMERIKENFEKQCIQNCLNIKTELERLPKLSRIVMEGETIPVISLKIPYKNEEEYKGSMAGYIDEIARKADDLENAEERMKFIKSRLSWKKLFSVIVRDMNGIKLTLYKRERIKEQSRYLPYEEAVGSTGQSQGIYIQFLISIINYISSINSKNSDASGLRKTIFLDNPFGAAKDVYIWEPIFKLLKTNNVQLIVPARGATPAITGRFDVNYVLGQKMTGKRLQTVVTDYFSNVESEEIEYTKMSYEQTSLF